MCNGNLTKRYLHALVTIFVPSSTFYTQLDSDAHKKKVSSCKIVLHFLVAQKYFVEVFSRAYFLVEKFYGS